MPPTFLIFLALIVYIGITTISFLIFVPMLFIDAKRSFAKKVLATVLISFPCLMIMGVFCTAIFILPALLFFWLINSSFIPKIPAIVLTIIGVLTFAGSVMSTSLYLWYFISKIFIQKIDRKSISEFVDKDKVYRFLRPYLIRVRILRAIKK